MHAYLQRRKEKVSNRNTEMSQTFLSSVAMVSRDRSFLLPQKQPIKWQKRVPLWFCPHSVFNPLHRHLHCCWFLVFFIIFRSGQCAVLFKLGGIKFNLYKDKKAFTEKYAGTQNDSGAVKHF